MSNYKNNDNLENNKKKKIAIFLFKKVFSPLLQGSLMHKQRTRQEEGEPIIQ